MAFDCFLKIEGVTGESSDEKHEGWIEILSFKHGVSVPRDAGSGLPSGRRVHQDFTVVKTVDKASPILVQRLCNNKEIKEVTIELCRATGDKQKYMEYLLQDVWINGIRLSGSPKGGEALPLEEVSFNYKTITWTHFETDHKTGKPKGQAMFIDDRTASV